MIRRYLSARERWRLFENFTVLFRSTFDVESAVSCIYYSASSGAFCFDMFQCGPGPNAESDAGESGHPTSWPAGATGHGAPGDATDVAANAAGDQYRPCGAADSGPPGRAGTSGAEFPGCSAAAP